VGDGGRGGRTAGERRFPAGRNWGRRCKKKKEKPVNDRTKGGSGGRWVGFDVLSDTREEEISR